MASYSPPLPAPSLPPRCSPPSPPCIPVSRSACDSGPAAITPRTSAAAVSTWRSSPGRPRALPVFACTASSAGRWTWSFAPATASPVATGSNSPSYPTSPSLRPPLAGGTRIAGDHAFLRAGVGRVIRYELGDGLGVLDLVRHGLGIAISPPMIVPPGLVSVPIGRYAPHFVVSLAVADREPSTPAREMLRIAAELSTGDSLSESTRRGWGQA